MIANAHAGSAVDELITLKGLAFRSTESCMKGTVLTNLVGRIDR